jgi:hypothetical protein
VETLPAMGNRRTRYRAPTTWLSTTSASPPSLRFLGRPLAALRIWLYLLCSLLAVCKPLRLVAADISHSTGSTAAPLPRCSGSVLNPSLSDATYYSYGWLFVLSWCIQVAAAKTSCSTPSVKFHCWLILAAATFLPHPAASSSMSTSTRMPCLWVHAATVFRITHSTPALLRGLKVSIALLPAIPSLRCPAPQLEQRPLSPSGHRRLLVFRSPAILPWFYCRPEANSTSLMVAAASASAALIGDPALGELFHFSFHPETFDPAGPGLGISSSATSPPLSSSIFRLHRRPSLMEAVRRMTTFPVPGP